MQLVAFIEHALIFVDTCTIQRCVNNQNICIPNEHAFVYKHIPSTVVFSYNSMCVLNYKNFTRISSQWKLVALTVGLMTSLL